jgi:hypothetical protein
VKEAEEPDPFDAALAAGGVSNFIPAGGAPIDWQVHLDANGPLVLGDYNSARLGARLDLTLETGKTIGDVASYRAVDFEGEAMQRISKSAAELIGGQRVTTSIGVAAGFAALHDRAESAPLNRSPSWTKVRVRASVKEKGKVRAWLEADAGPDQRLGGRWRPVMGIAGGAEIPMASGSAVKAMLVGRALKALVLSTVGEPDWQVQLGLMLSI